MMCRKCRANGCVNVDPRHCRECQQVKPFTADQLRQSMETSMMILGLVAPVNMDYEAMATRLAEAGVTSDMTLGEVFDRMPPL